MVGQSAAARRIAITATLALAAVLGACKVVPIDEAGRIREAQGGQFDAQALVNSLWTTETREALRARAVPLDRLQRGPLDALGKSNGTRAGEGSPWTFVTQVSGTVKSITSDQPRGAVILGGPAGDVRIQTGPVVSGTTIRDALPAINFDDFPSQIAFAEVGQGLTDRAIAEVRPTVERLRIGDRVTVFGIVNLGRADEAVVLTPLSIGVEAGAR